MLKEKAKKHIPWEAFWKSIALFGMGIVSVIYGIIKFNEWGILYSSLAIIGGIILSIFSFYTIRISYKKM